MARAVGGAEGAKDSSLGCCVAGCGGSQMTAQAPAACRRGL